MDHVIGFGVRSILRTIAVTSETISGKRSKTSEEDTTEVQWELDEAASSEETSQVGYVAQPASSEVETLGVSESGSANLDTAQSFELRPLPKPILIPQRRPNNKSRGWVRAYAPTLGTHSGISQEAFLGFITSWDAAIKASPVFTVLNIAALATGMVPDVHCLAFSIAASTVAEIGQELEIRYKSNKYLEDANNSLFQPRKLFAMILTYKPELADEPILQADATDPSSLALTKYLPETSKAKQVFRRLRTSSGIVKGDHLIPECESLVYPSLDIAITSNSPSKLSSLKQNNAIITDYLDRRAQADFLSKNPSSKIAQQLPPRDKQFVNRYCDPNHPANSGSVFGLLTGGTFDPIAQGRVSRARSKAKMRGEPELTEEELHDAYMGRKVRGRTTGTPSKELPIVGKLLKKDVLYLFIMNVPDEGRLRATEESVMQTTRNMQSMLSSHSDS